jgi:hypothetical protein
MFDRLNMTLRRLVKSGNVVELTPIARIDSTTTRLNLEDVATRMRLEHAKRYSDFVGCKRILMDSGG